MSEPQVFAVDEQALQPSAGELLKQAREATGLHIAALAVSLKVPVKKLEALEANRFDLLADAVFVRALASSVCRSLKIDPIPILARLPHSGASRLTHHGLGINAPFHSPGERPGINRWGQVSKPAVLAGLILLFGALILVFLPAIKAGMTDVKFKIAASQITQSGTISNVGEVANGEREKSPALPAQANAAVGLPGLLGSAVELPAQPASGNTSAVSPGNLSLILTTSAASSVTTPEQTALSRVSTPAAPLTAADDTVRSVSDADVIVFTAKGQSWVEATDAKGQIVLRRMLMPGDIAGASGALPIKVVIGRANETVVHIRGKSFDLSAVAKDNVARFEVK